MPNRNARPGLRKHGRALQESVNSRGFASKKKEGILLKEIGFFAWPAKIQNIE
jgi:hypothetical protein